MQKNGRLESVGINDDLAMSLALANWATKEFKGKVVLLDDVMENFENWFDGNQNNRNNGGWMIP